MNRGELFRLYFIEYPDAHLFCNMKIFVQKLQKLENPLACGITHQDLKFLLKFFQGFKS